MSFVLQRHGRSATLKSLRGAAEVMLCAQTPGGAIPWFEGGPWDPWNHAECLMALAAMGEDEAVERGFNHLSEAQLPDGSWLGEYGNALPMADRLRLSREPAPAFRDTNFAAYPATALWHHVRLTGDASVARRHWPMVRAAIDFVLGLQHPAGDVSWSAEGHGTGVDDALLAGNSSIYKSLDCALKLADLVGDPQPGWEAAQRRLRRAILCEPERFGRARSGGSAFAMDWYYPMLGGVFSPAAGLARLETRWRVFVKPGLGCRCVDDQPWVTVAESCELAMALSALGSHRAAATMLDWQFAHRGADGAFWMGYQFEEQIFWPEERPTWTQAAAILAFDAVNQVTPAFDVLTTSD
ncbi:MAG: hypothetical protein ACK4YQ_12865 [Phenylobacterium sp.]|uniref:hypothetical protein n=1 Tax=Phenylobacterium sp. TaxID=1871053 RepID=UPI003919A5B1